ncbi:MAG: hypothetical protein FWG87_11010 [Defluviitaleaceae bacterium]|nr:hypothetical protein [Defluviitaleaceae bacterium]
MSDENKKNDIDDLEAQLSSLGLFNDNGEDMFGELNFDGDDPFAALEALSAPRSSVTPITLDDLDSLDELNSGLPDELDEPASAESAAASDGFNLDDLAADDFAPSDFGLDDFAADSDEPLSMANDEMDLDSQLEMLLMADRVAGDSFEVKDISSSMPTQTVYDPEIEDMVSIQYVKGAFTGEAEAKKSIFANVSQKTMIATLIIGITVIATGAITALLAHSAVRAQQSLAAAVEHFTPIQIPTGVANNANIIHLHEQESIGEQTLTLLRISAAYSGTFFYFDEIFEPSDYDILLFDQNRNLFSRTTFNISAPEGTGTVLQFGKVLQETLFLTLHIQHKVTGEFTRFYYRFTSPPVHETPVFITQQQPLMGDSPLVVSHALFDSASSTIHFNYRETQQSEGYRLRSDSDFAKVEIHEINTAPTPLTGDEYVYVDALDMKMGFATFAPILNLESRINLVFHGLTYFYKNPVVDVTPQQLFANSQSTPVPVQTGDFTLMLESMDQQGPLIVLTLHGVDGSRRRRATNLDAVLRVRVSDDEVIDMQGTVVNIDPDGRGSDVLFNMQPHGTHLFDVHISQYSLIINWVEYDVPSATMPLNVSRFYNQPSLRRYAAETAVTQAFLNLLAYKSGEVTESGLLGISDELKGSGELFNLFAPTKFEGRAMYAASVTTGELATNYDYAAIVEVVWAAEENGDLKYEHGVFGVTARSRDNIWTVVEVSR